MIKKIQLLLIITLLYGLVFSPQFVNAQEHKIIIAEGHIFSTDSELSNEDTYHIDDFLVLEFPSSGGMVTGSGFLHQLILIFGAYVEYIFSGELHCSDNGKIGGTVTQNVFLYYAPTQTFFDKEFDHSLELTWYGQLYADGTGQGVIDFGDGLREWEITFPPDNFCSEAQPVFPEVPAEVEISDEDNVLPVEEEQPPEIVDPEPDEDEVLIPPEFADLETGSIEVDSEGIGGSWLAPAAIIGIIGALGAVGVVGAAAAAILAGVLKGGAAASGAAGAAGAAKATIPKRASSQSVPRGQRLPDNFIEGLQFGGPSDNPNINYDHQEDECRPF